MLGLREGAPGVNADHHTCINMVTGAALYMMVPPALLVILSPLIFGIGLGPDMLAGVLLGAIGSGFVLGGMMNAAGGAWDNAKKVRHFMLDSNYFIVLTHCCCLQCR